MNFSLLKAISGFPLRSLIARPGLPSRIKDERARGMFFVSQAIENDQAKNFASWLLQLGGCFAIRKVAGNAGRIHFSASIPIMKKLQKSTTGERVFAGRTAKESAASDPKAPGAGDRSASAGYVISCRLAGEEVAAFDRLCAELGAKSRSEGVRLVVRMASGFLEFSRRDAGHLDGLRQELHRIGTGVNQVALAANRGRIDLVRAQWEALNELRRALPGMRTLLGQVVAERRRQGVTLFREFVAREEGRNG